MDFFLSKLPYTVVSYYTPRTIYEDYVECLRESEELYEIPHHIQAVPDLGSWALNTSYKPSFIADMLELYDRIAYVDIDAEFKRYPILFDTLDCDISAAIFKQNYNRPCAKEMLSGTIFIKRTEWTIRAVRRWIEECRRAPDVWDQIHLEKIVGSKNVELPPEYCTIYDRMNYVKNPVIVHKAASRIVRKRRTHLKNL